MTNIPVGLTQDNSKMMLLVLYNCLISFTLLAVFALGALSFSDDLLAWIDKHWEEIR